MKKAKELIHTSYKDTSYHLSINRFKYLLQEQQRAYIHNISKYDYFGYDYDRNMARLEFFKNVLNASRFPIMDGVNKGTIAKTAGYFTICTIAYPDVRRTLSSTTKNALEPYAKILAEKYPEQIGRFYKKCESCLHDYVPYTPEIAAMDEIALGINFYNAIRKPGLTKSNKTALKTKYVANLQQLHNICKDENISQDQIIAENQRAVVNLIMNEPEARRYFSGIYGTGRIDLSKVEIEKAVILKNRNITEVEVYEPPKTGFSYKSLDSKTENKFEIRPIQSVNFYNDTLYEIFKDSYEEHDCIIKVLHEEVNDTDKVIKQANELKRLMIDDGFSSDTILHVFQSCDERCSMYFDVSRKGISATPTDLLKETKSTFILNDIISEVPKKDESFYYKLQDIKRDFNFKDSMTEMDYLQLASMINSLSNEVNPYKYPNNEKLVYASLKEEPELSIQKFLDELKNESLTEEQKHIYELIHAISKTDAPVINEKGRLIATRCLYDTINIGQEGGIIRGDSVIEPGAWVDENSFVKDSHIGSGVILCMNTSVIQSDIRGVGTIVNTRLTNCNMQGTYSPYEMRREVGITSNPAQILSLNNKQIHFENMKIESGKKQQEKNKKLALRYLPDFLDKSVGQYLHEQFLKSTHNKNGIIKPTAEQRAKKEREDAINQQVAQMGQKIAHLEESKRKAAKASLRTHTLRDDLFVFSLGGEFGEQLVNDSSVTLDMIDNPLSAFDFDFED